MRYSESLEYANPFSQDLIEKVFPILKDSYSRYIATTMRSENRFFQKRGDPGSGETSRKSLYDLFDQSFSMWGNNLTDLKRSFRDRWFIERAIVSVVNVSGVWPNEILKKRIYAKERAAVIFICKSCKVERQSVIQYLGISSSRFEDSIRKAKKEIQDRDSYFCLLIQDVVELEIGESFECRQNHI